MTSDELIVDLFAGGGGASQGIYQALGRHPDIAINHDDLAIAVHRRNHPETHHLCTSVWNVKPEEVCAGRPVGLLWASPDCRHFSRAAGGRPKWKSVRSLPGVVLTWAKRTRPRVIIVENVREMVGWGPLLDDGTPCPDRVGRSFNQWVGRLRALGYAVQWKEVCAADYGAPTVRTRLFIQARCDGLPINWPTPTHSREPSLFEQRRWRGAAECIDWSIPSPSIFTRRRPLADATLRRIAQGIDKYVLGWAQPFIIRIGHPADRERVAADAPGVDEALVAAFVAPITHHGNDRGQSLTEPLATVTAAHRGEMALFAAHILTNTTGHPGSAAEAPLSTIATGGHHALVEAAIAPHISIMRGTSVGSFAGDPLRTVTAGGGHHAVISAFIAQHNLGNIGRDAEDPLSTITTRGTQQAVVEAILSEEDTAGAVRVAAFLARYRGDRAAPRFRTIAVDGVARPIVDIGMRMLAPHELAAAQGFPPEYDLTDGGRLTKTATVRLIGNSVSPAPAEAVVRAAFLAREMRAAA